METFKSFDQIDKKSGDYKSDDNVHTNVFSAKQKMLAC